MLHGPVTRQPAAAHEKGCCAAACRRRPHLRPTLQVVQICAQLVRTAGVLELADRLGLDLADAFTRHVELLAHFFQRVVGAHLDAEAHAQHLGLARGQAVEDVFDHIAQAGLHRGLDRRGAPSAS